MSLNVDTKGTQPPCSSSWPPEVRSIVAAFRAGGFAPAISGHRHSPAAVSSTKVSPRACRPPPSLCTHTDYLATHGSSLQITSAVAGQAQQNIRGRCIVDGIFAGLSIPARCEIQLAPVIAINCESSFNLLVCI